MARVQVLRTIFLGGRRWRRGLYPSFPDTLISQLPSSAVLLEEGENELSERDYRQRLNAQAEKRKDDNALLSARKAVAEANARLQVLEGDRVNIAKETAEELRAKIEAEVRAKIEAETAAAEAAAKAPKK